jgi:hypothetical protein
VTSGYFKFLKSSQIFKDSQSRHNLFFISVQLYEFYIEDFTSPNDIITTPTARRAAQLCTLELEGLEFHHPDLVNPEQHDHTVQEIVAKWFSPVFNCSADTFHLAVWHIATQRFVDSQHVANVAHGSAGG